MPNPARSRERSRRSGGSLFLIPALPTALSGPLRPTGTAAPAPASYGYRWRANGVAIPGATGPSYVPVASALGTKLTVAVTALRTGHLSGAAWTRSTGAVAG
ncbi:hypothetical protein EDD98_2692 [Streptomyces sp. PanSC19]|uniref:hypothetical protein n=1 Tax=Streptomyces sp. PanSC19 TaxID=1520455 RepID=UPI000F493B5C|nr:hypothetical protein [Streptomyces sp. PanSC19]ROQ33664.1 hypothetical protein EDD98_2692 [Streptomyces sp. PanSC19]